MPEWYKSADKVAAEKLDKAERQARRKRLTLLQESDYTVLPDVPVKSVQGWKAYRKALRDITDQEGFPFDIEWPVKPEEVRDEISGDTAE